MYIISFLLIIFLSPIIYKIVATICTYIVNYHMLINANFIPNMQNLLNILLAFTLSCNTQNAIEVETMFITRSPLDQFEIRNFLSLDAPILANLHLSLTNIGLYLTIAASIILVLNLSATNYNKVIANN